MTVGEIKDKTMFPVFNGFAPSNGGPKAMPLVLDFSANAQVEFDLIDAVQRGAVEFVQSAWIDNSDNPNALTISFSQTGQRLKIPAGASGCWPIIAPSGLRCVASTIPGGGVIAYMILLNVPMPMTQFGPVSVAGTLALPLAAYTNHSLVLTGISQLLIPANANRKSVMISAPSTNANSVWINFGAGATMDFNSYEISPLGNLPPNIVPPNQDIFVIGTAGEHVYASEGV